MRQIRPESDLVCASHVGEIFTKLIDGGVRDAGSGLPGKEIERSIQTKEHVFWIIRRIVEVLHAEIAPGEKIRKRFHIGRAKDLPAEGTDHRRADRISVAKSKRLDAAVKVWVGYGDDCLAVVIARSVEPRHFIASEQRLLCTHLIVHFRDGQPL